MIHTSTSSIDHDRPWFPSVLPLPSFSLATAVASTGLRRASSQSCVCSIARLAPDTVLQAEVQIFMSEDGEAAPATWIYFTGADNRVERSDSTVIFAGQFLQIACGLDGMDRFGPRYFTDNEGYGDLGLTANAVKAWFAECW